MTNKRTQDERDQTNAIKDPEDWTTGDEPMTGAQKSYLTTLATEAGEEIDENMTKAEASKKIDELQQKTGRGQNK
jgi:hypothetical protein